MVFTVFSESQKRSVTEAMILNFTSKLNPLSETVGSSFPLGARVVRVRESGCPVITGGSKSPNNIVPITDFLAKLIIEPSS